MTYMVFRIADNTLGRSSDKTRQERWHLGSHHLHLRCTGASEAATIRAASSGAARKACSSSVRISKGIWP